MSYPLSALEQARQALEQEAQRALAQAEHAYAAAKERSARAAEELRAHRAAAPEPASVPRSGVELRRYAETQDIWQTRERELRQALARALRADRTAEASVARARERLIATAVDRRVIERHREGWERGEGRAADRRDDDELEELGRRAR